MLQKWMKLLISITGIYSCYLYYGVLQQKLYLKQADGSRFTDTAFVLTVQCIFNALISALWIPFESASSSKKNESGNAKKSDGKESQKKPSLFEILLKQEVMVVAFVYVFAMYSSNESLKYVDYAYQALAKSCKLIPVMVGSILIMKKEYAPIKYLCVLAMTAGIGAYEFMKDAGGAHGKGSAGTSHMGLLLLAASLALDGLSGPGQEKLKEKIKMSGAEQCICSNVWGFLYMFFTTAFLGQLSSSYAYLSSHPDLVWNLVTFSICSGLGQVFIFFTIREFDSLTLTTITTTRKFATIVVNAIVLPKDNVLNANQWGCVLVVFGAVALDAYTEAKEKSKGLGAGVHVASSPAEVKPAGKNSRRKSQGNVPVNL
jgi:UDP-galactose transporter B1